MCVTVVENLNKQRQPPPALNAVYLIKPDREISGSCSFIFGFWNVESKNLAQSQSENGSYSWLRFACSRSFCAVWDNSCRTCQGNHPIIIKWVFNPSTFSVCSFSVQRVEFLQLDFVRLWSAGCIQASFAWFHTHEWMFGGQNIVGVRPT
jgi:hypothetical protein